MSKVCAGLLFLIVSVPSLFAKDVPFQTATWPDTGQTVLRFTFSKFKDVGGIGKEHTYVTDTIAENLSDKRIGSGNFALYVFDKTKARIGEGQISLNNVGPGETVKFQVTMLISGTPASLTVSANAPRTISVTINSVPQGALFKVDGKEMGTTPKMVEVAIGKHMLEFSREGFNTGKFPLEMSSRDVSGGASATSLEVLLTTQSNCEMGPF